MQHHVDIAGCAECGGDARDQREACGAAAFLVVTAGIVDGDGGMSREHLEQGDVGAAEHVRRFRADAEEADEPAAPADRQADDAVLGERRQRDVGEVAIARDDRFAAGQHASGEADVRAHLGADLIARHAVRGFGANDIALRHVQADGAVVGPDQPAGRFDQARQQWLQFQFRGHVLDHLAQRIEAVAFAEVVVHAAILVVA